MSDFYTGQSNWARYDDDPFYCVKCGEGMRTRRGDDPNWNGYCRACAKAEEAKIDAKMKEKDTGLNLTFPDGRKFIIEKKSTKCRISGSKNGEEWIEYLYFIREEMPNRNPKARYLDIDDGFDTQPNFTFFNSHLNTHGLSYHKAEIFLFLMIPLIKERLYKGQEDVAIDVRWDWNGKRETTTSWGWWNGRNNLSGLASMQGERL